MIEQNKQVDYLSHQSLEKTLDCDFRLIVVVQYSPARFRELIRHFRNEAQTESG